MTDALPAPPFPSSRNDLTHFIADLPKAELHLHLEGSVEPRILRQLARRNRLPSADWRREDFERIYRYTDFLGFLQAFKIVSEHLKTPADYRQITHRLAENLAGQKVSYAEVTFSAGVLLAYDENVEPFFEAAAEGAQQGERDYGVKVNWIFDAVRQFGVEPAQKVVRLAARFQNHGVVAFGIGGDEVKAPAELFRKVFQEARDAGLHCVAHAGEAAGPESVRAAVEVLGAERIGHGLKAAWDPALVELLAERRVPLEICLSSNLATGVLDRLENHPLPQWLAAGVPVTLNTDDPAMFHTNLNREYALAARTFKLSHEQLNQIAGQSFRASFGKIQPE